MKKIFGLMIAMCALVLLAGCTKEEVKKEGDRQIFAKQFIEEMEGEEVEVTNVVIFNGDKTGTVAIQDVIPMTYDTNTIKYEDGTLMYNYLIDGCALTLTNGDVTLEFTLADESILEKIPDVE
ncbi:MAG: hypothetical protein MJ246_06220 [Clostridia bacterium]|nr:hypothetical protein [Clostridia bacterium]